MKVFIPFLILMIQQQLDYNTTLVLKAPLTGPLRQTVYLLIDKTVVCIKQTVTIIHLGSLKCFFVCREKPRVVENEH